ncbi:protein-disulfide reductase DsbD domain-containing protein [Mangrovimonas xylaniphaga]|uniref:protein-disulfide reductase DsbD domain-containing protein n=1 Tax=Mangrovimonas xylaniphaga TaxID=1645915 RepID=UPI0006B48BE5|nr:protein-disulfide reductase DsbD domain-containing protein [Mangrovimonas xylaniphaga]
MKKILALLVLCISFNASAQIFDPVKWSTSVVKISDTEYDLIATATIEEHWHLYSQDVPENGPRPTKFVFENNGQYLKKGNTKEGAGHEVDDPIFEMRIKYFDNQADFKQRIRLKSKESFTVKGTVEFMVCNDTQCLPPKEVDLEFKVGE